MEPTSKAFRVTLPDDLDEAQLDKLKRWTEASCAAGLVLREEKSVILIATRERARTKEAFMRSVRGTIGRLGIATNARKMRWLTLTSEDSVAAEITRHGCAGQSIEALPMKIADAVDETAEEMGDDDNVRLIALPSAKSSAKSSASMIRVAKV